MLFQERLLREPFWMLVACQLVNLTTWEQARPAFNAIRRDCRRSILRLALADPEDLHDVLRPLGMWRRRAVILPRMARAWLRSRPGTYDEVLEFPGCGRYAADSWAIFMEGRDDVEPRDGKLNWYIDRLRQEAPSERGTHHADARADRALRRGDHRAPHPRPADEAVARP